MFEATMTLRKPEKGWRLLYDLSADRTTIAQIQNATLETENYGIEPDPHLFGSGPWWQAIRTGETPVTWLDGTVSSVRWGSMGDWPLFRLLDQHGKETEWTRKGDPRRYVVGLRVRLAHVAVKSRYPLSGDHSDHVLEIWIEDANVRTAGVAPGPGGVGYDEFGGVGALVHYVVFKDEAQADAAIEAVPAATGRTWSE